MELLPSKLACHYRGRPFGHLIERCRYSLVSLAARSRQYRPQRGTGVWGPWRFGVADWLSGGTRGERSPFADTPCVAMQGVWRCRWTCMKLPNCPTAGPGWDRPSVGPRTSLARAA